MPPVTAAAYSFFLNIFQYFPIVTIIQWFLPWYPQGKTSVSSRLNLPGRYAWCLMEIVGPVNLLYTLFFTTTTTSSSEHVGLSSYRDLPFANKLIAGLYVLHYLNRAIITPLFYAPSMSPIHVVIMLSAVTFNYLNSSCLAGWVLGYGVPLKGYNGHEFDAEVVTKSFISSYCLAIVGLFLFASGMYGNICSEHTLFRLRREAAEKKDSSHREQEKNVTKYDKIYVIPPAKGFFKTILFPHYVCEWIEWFGFALVGFAIINPSGTANINSSSVTPDVTLAPYYLPLANVLINRLHLSFPLPPVLSFVNITMTTAVRANSGRNWYVKRFGEKEVAGRGSVIPYCKWF
ncbi:hypothetical protein KEM54_005692 [Ascosphaera aggregata]|nr:hypothetical protein KEM54_005692 [Ascosphaera aggregata]